MMKVIWIIHRKTIENRRIVEKQIENKKSGAEKKSRKNREEFKTVKNCKLNTKTKNKNNEKIN